MKDRIGEEFDARVVGITTFGLRVRLNEFFVEGFIHVSYMTDDFYQLDERTMRLAGRHTRKSYFIGQELRVRVDRVDLEEREIIMGVCDQGKRIR